MHTVYKGELQSLSAYSNASHVSLHIKHFRVLQPYRTVAYFILFFYTSEESEDLIFKYNFKKPKIQNSFIQPIPEEVISTCESRHGER